MALKHIKQHKKTKYIFLSSGVVYGGNYQTPVDENTNISTNTGNLEAMDWYVIAKQNAEKKHRRLSDFPIVDIRVFNYFSHTQDVNARLLMSDIVRAITNRTVFKTSSDNIVKDFITPPDFYNLIQLIIDFKSINTVLDCYTKSPISKCDLLDELESEFGLEYEIEDNVDVVNATRFKLNYYSLNKMCNGIGYRPIKTSMEGVVQEIRLLIKDD